MKLTKTECRLMVEFLNELLDRFGNDGCNDYCLENTKENKKFLENAIRASYSKKDAKAEIDELNNLGEDNTLATTNILVLDYLIEKFKKVNGIK